MDLVVAAAAVLILAIAMYVVLDGFDLGVGILFPFAPGETERDRMIDSISPFWDGNETWLVLGGVTLFAGFPLAYSLLLPALYPGIIVFLVALVFRGVVFEFRPGSHRRWLWNGAFAAGSTFAAFAQGLVLGSFVEGFELPGGRYVGGAFGWLTPFSVMAGVGLVCGYALLGATWLVNKTDGELQAWAFRAARPLTLVLLGFILLVSVWTPLAQPAIAERWFAPDNLLWLWPVPLLTGLLGWQLWHDLGRRHERHPFRSAAGLFLLAYLGLAISLWPYVVPRHYTVWQAAAPAESLAFILVGVAVLLPLVLGYTVHTYRIFRGKSGSHGYH